MQAAIYCRISDDREGAGLGVQRQEEDCRALADRRGWNIEAVYIDNDISAYSGRPRPRYRALLDDLRAGQVQAVIAWHPDRLHRSPRELEEFIGVVESTRAEVATVSAGDLDLATPTGRMTARVVGAVARHESEHKSERVRRKMVELAKNGKVHAGRLGYGFRPGADGWEVDPDQANLIRELAAQLLAGGSLVGMVTDLNRRGVPGPRGGKWQVTALRWVLRAARLAGLREHRGEIIGKGDWPAIIDLDTHKAIRSLLNDPVRRRRRKPRSYLLSGGLLRCCHCGGPLVATKKAGNDSRRYYGCKVGPGTGGCGRTYVQAEPVEEVITTDIFEVVDGPDFAARLDRRDGQRPEARSQLDRLESKLAELGEMWHADEISRAEFVRLRSPLMAEIEQARKEEARQVRDAVLDPYRDRSLRAAWPALPLDRKRAVIMALIESVTIGPAQRGRKPFDPGRIGEPVWKV